LHDSAREFHSRAAALATTPVVRTKIDTLCGREGGQGCGGSTRCCELTLPASADPCCGSVLQSIIAPMNRPNAPVRNQLKDIARPAMLHRGLLPDFSAAGVAETAALTHAAVDAEPAARDMRDLLWASIDNDDSRDLDQLSVAMPLAGGAVKILVAV